ncbi:MAG: hypothetical protein JWM11_4304 [Planctomycetaceae bacterium]|nr:hypothetical protein [Planctomycetaceae bacterium]
MVSELATYRTWWAWRCESQICRSTRLGPFDLRLTNNCYRDRYKTFRSHYNCPQVLVVCHFGSSSERFNSCGMRSAVCCQSSLRCMRKLADVNNSLVVLHRMCFERIQYQELVERILSVAKRHHVSKQHHADWRALRFVDISTSFAGFCRTDASCCKILCDSRAIVSYSFFVMLTLCAAFTLC